MKEMNRYEFLNSPFMTPEEVNLLLMEPGLEEMASPNLKKGVKSEMIELLKNDLSGVLMLPFRKTETE